MHRKRTVQIFSTALTGSSGSSLGATPLVSALPRTHSALYYPPRALDRFTASPGTLAHAILAPTNAWPCSLHVVRPSLATTIIPRVGHWLQLDAPEAFANASTPRSARRSWRGAEGSALD
jgi:hypothetical protein